MAEGFDQKYVGIVAAIIGCVAGSKLTGAVLARKCLPLELHSAILYEVMVSVLPRG